MPAKVLRDTRFSNKRLDSVGVEALAVSELYRRVSARRLAGPERVEFFMVLVVTQGKGNTGWTSSGSNLSEAERCSFGRGRYRSGGCRRPTKATYC